MTKFGSRKFIVTMTGMFLCAGLAVLSKVDANVALVLGAGIGAYNWANVKYQANGNGK